MPLLEDLGKLNRYIFTKWSFIENRKLLLLWANAMAIFSILSMVNPVYTGYTLVLAIIFIIVEVGEFLSKKKPKLEGESEKSKDRELKIGRLTIHLDRKQAKKQEQKSNE